MIACKLTAPIEVQQALVLSDSYSMSIAPTQHKHRLPKAQALLLSLPDPEHQSTTWESAFASAAERVLHGLELIIFGKRFRLVEVEF